MVRPACGHEPPDPMPLELDTDGAPEPKRRSCPTCRTLHPVTQPVCHRCGIRIETGEPVEPSSQERLKRVLRADRPADEPLPIPALLVATLTSPDRAFRFLSWQILRPQTMTLALVLFFVSVPVTVASSVVRERRREAAAGRTTAAIGAREAVNLGIIVVVSATVTIVIVAVQAGLLTFFGQSFGGGGSFVVMLLCLVYLNGWMGILEGARIPLLFYSSSAALISYFVLLAWSIFLLYFAVKNVFDLEGAMAWAAIVFTGLAMYLIQNVLAFALMDILA